MGPQALVAPGHQPGCVFVCGPPSRGPALTLKQNSRVKASVETAEAGVKTELLKQLGWVLKQVLKQ